MLFANLLFGIKEADASKLHFDKSLCLKDVSSLKLKEGAWERSHRIVHYATVIFKNQDV